MTATVAAEALQIHFRLRGQGVLRAVDGVSLAIRPQETLGIIGESGSGKSTLGRAMVGMTAPSGGQVLHDGQDPWRLRGRAWREHRRDYQLVFQDPNAALDPRMSVLQSVREPLDIGGSGTSADRNRRTMAMLDRVGLTVEQAGRYPHELSGGQKQRVNIARTLTLAPRFIVCDEMVAALDVSIQADILNLFAELRREFGLTTLFITHDIGVVTHVSDRVGVMYLGQMMELGDTPTISTRPLHPYTRALLSAEPELVRAEAGRIRRRVTLEGEVPSPLNPPSGCRFRTRCPLAAELCAAEEPAWRDAGGGHFVACHFATNEQEEIAT
jgi:oligopeptide/dipeptide ABC transporter ATP-binding protein